MIGNRAMKFLIKMKWLLKTYPHGRCTLMVPHIKIELGGGVRHSTKRGHPILFYPYKRCFNNVSEYQALILGLKMTVDIKQLQLQVFSDSQLVIKQLLGSYEVRKPELQPYHDYTQKLMRCLGEVTLQHVSRRENKKSSPNPNKTRMSEWKNLYGLYSTTYRTPTQATPYSLAFEVEAVFPLKRQIPSLRLTIQEGLTNEENAKLHLAELEAFDEKRLEAQQNLECYQACLSHSFNKRVRLSFFSDVFRLLQLQAPSHFGKNKLSGEIPTSLFHSNLSLIHLLAENNNFSRINLDTLGLVQTMKVLRLDWNSFSGSVPEMLNDLTHVQEIHSSVLNYFALSGFIDQYDLSYGLSFDTYGEYYKNMREFYQYLPRLLKPGTPLPGAHYEGLPAGHICHILAQVRKKQYMTLQLTPNTNNATKAESSFIPQELGGLDFGEDIKFKLLKVLAKFRDEVVEANETVASRTVVRFGYTKPKLALVFANLLVDPYQIMMANVAIETPLENLEPVLQENIQKLWDSDPKLQAHKGTPLSDFFNVEVVALSSYQEKEEQFKEQVASLRQRSIHSIAPDRLGGDRRAVVLALGFTFSAKEIWNIANENKDLDLPAHKVMVATVRCEEIFHYLYRK
ncbi:hypothetical protein FXO38_15570 [Capsicum annuum]|nr:hypothetical protein FXO38_15570 [Capsicum annuum]